MTGMMTMVVSSQRPYYSRDNAESIQRMLMKMLVMKRKVDGHYPAPRYRLDNETGFD